MDRTPSTNCIDIVLTLVAAVIFHGHVTLAPDCRDGDVELLSAKAFEGRTEILAVDNKTKNAFVHVKNH